MKKLNTYRIELTKHEFKSLEVKADCVESAEEIAKLKVPEGFDIIYSGETPESIVQRFTEDIKEMFNPNKK